MELGAIDCRSFVKRENTTVEGRKDFIRQPSAKNPTLSLVFPLNPLNSNFELENRDAGNIEVATLYSTDPPFQVGINHCGTSFTELRNDTGV